MAGGRIVLEIRGGVEELLDEWEELAEQLRANPFRRPGWVVAWETAFGAGRFEVVTARRDGRLVGVLPLERRRRMLVSPANSHVPEAGPIAVDAIVARALLDRAFGERTRVVSLGPLDAGSDDLRLGLEAAKSAGCQTLVRASSRAPFICGRGLDEFRRGVSANLRHDVERRQRRLCERGAVYIEVRDGHDRLTEALDEGLRVESMSWKGAAGTAIASQPATARFYTEVARWAASRGWLRLAFLCLDDRAIAFQFDLEALGTYYSLKIGYDPAYESFSPGKLLMYAMVARAMSNGLASYELLGMDEPWKLRWADGFRSRSTLHAFSSSPAGRLTHSAFVSRKAIARIPLASRAAAALRRSS